MSEKEKALSKKKEHESKRQGLLLDATYEDTENESVIKLFISNKKERFWVTDKSYHPYLYVSCEKGNEAKTIQLLKEFTFGHEQKFKALEVEKTKAQVLDKPILKVSFNKVSELVTSREYFNNLGFQKYEYDINFGKRYLIDNGLEPCNGVEFTTNKDNNLTSIKKIDLDFDTKMVSYDLETMTGKRFEIGAEPILFYSSVWNEKNAKGKYKGKIVSYEIPEVRGIKVVESETELITELENDLKDTDIIVTYNGDNFDFSYTKIRAKKLKIDFLINGKDPRVNRSGLDNAVKLSGVQHFDSFQVIQFLQRTGAINSPKLDIETVSEKVFGVKKEKVYPAEINDAWLSKDDEKIDRVAQYNLEDSETALRIAEEFLPLFIEISKLTSQTLFDSTRSATSNMVEDLLLKEAHVRGMIAPNKPKEGEVTERTMNPIKGAFVKEPMAGLHEDIAVLDFASLYPTIIISHNISPETLNCKHAECKKENSSPDTTWFCKKEKGMFPEILGTMLKKRLTFKREYKEKKKKGIDDKTLFAKQWALKIVLNSVYGYLGYPRARWYSRECASAVTAFEREYIKSSLATAEKEGFKALYSDSITNERFVTVLNPQNEIEVINIEELFENSQGFSTERNGKEVKLIEGYKALSVNKDTLISEWTTINEIIRHKSKKKIYQVSQKYGETRCTEDHSIIVLNKERRLIEKKPIEMEHEKFFVIKSIPTTNNINKIDLFDLVKNYKYTRRYKNKNAFSQWHCNDTHIWFGFFNIKKQIQVKRFIEMDSKEFISLCRLLGAYIAEGSASTIETSKNKCGASIASSNTEWLKELENDYNSLFINAKTCIIRSTKKLRKLTYGKKNKTIEYTDLTHKLQMMNETTAVFFKMLCGQKSFGKRLPQFIFNVENEYKRILLDKMIEGDGSHSVNKRLGYSQKYIEKNFSYTTKSVGLISGVSLLLNQLKVNYSINFREEKQTYTIKTCDKNNESLLTKIKERSYDGFVYDLAVNKNNNFVDACGQVLLHNTDSAFLLMQGKSKKDVEDFAEKINKSLPEDMELEIDGFYKRGIFVTKKEGGAAKKRYALIDEKGNLKIVGFEYVRRDWCTIAKETQKKVLELVLSEGKEKEAVLYVKKILKELKEGKTPKKDLAIMTMLQRKPEDYDSIGPHVAAAKKAIERGKDIGVGSMLSFIITKPKKDKASISDKAELEEYVKEGDYDADYYIDNQVMPAVIKIMHELGYSEEDLLGEGKQTGLGSWS